jgi:hypothetical protein
MNNRSEKKVTEDGIKSVYIVHKIVKKVIIEDGQAPKAVRFAEIWLLLMLICCEKKKYR